MDAQNESDPGLITAAQIRAARALLGWTREEAAKICGVGRNTLGRFEQGEYTPTPRILQDVARVFEENGVIFISERGGRGVLLTSAGTAEAGEFRR